MKLCKKCNQEKTEQEFYSYKYQCKACHHSYQTKERKKKYMQDHYKKRKETDPALFMWKQAKHRAKYDYDNMEFTISKEDIQLPEKCPYFGVPLSPLDPKWGYSLDRIDSFKGYIPGNIQVISRLANQMKNAATEQELISFAKGVLEVHQGGMGRVT